MPKELYEDPTAPADRMWRYEAGQDGLDEGMESERITFDGGIKLFLKGHPYPIKGLPTPEALWAVNQAKTVVQQNLRLFGLWVLLVPPKQLADAFMRMLWPVMAPVILKHEYLTPVAQEVYRIALCLTGNDKASKVIAHVLEYDQAYRFRLQDLLSETSSQALIAHPRQELNRLLALNRVRDYKQVSDKIGRIGRVVSYALVIPSVRRVFRKALSECDFKKLQFDDADRYWACFKTDYRYFGKSSAERRKVADLAVKSFTESFSWKMKPTAKKCTECGSPQGPLFSAYPSNDKWYCMEHYLNLDIPKSVLK